MTEFLPLGSVILLKGGMQKILIISRALKVRNGIDFDEPFMGTLNPEEALLVHLGIPVKGLKNDENFMVSDIHGNFEDVRITVH